MRRNLPNLSRDPVQSDLIPFSVYNIREASDPENCSCCREMGESLVVSGSEWVSGSKLVFDSVFS